MEEIILTKNVIEPFKWIGMGNGRETVLLNAGIYRELFFSEASGTI